MHVVSLENLALRDLITLTVKGTNYGAPLHVLLVRHATSQDVISQRKYTPVLLNWNHMKTNQNLEV
jgi:hypothetical protein